MTPTREQIIRLAMEAGLYSGNPRTPSTGRMIEKRLERFASLIGQAACADENEACAQEADAHASVEGIAQRIAAAIRARITTQPETQND